MLTKTKEIPIASSPTTIDNSFETRDRVKQHSSNPNISVFNASAYPEVIGRLLPKKRQLLQHKRQNKSYDRTSPQSFYFAVEQEYRQIASKRSTTEMESLVSSKLILGTQEQEQDSELDGQEQFWRGVFTVPKKTQILFSEEIEIKVSELPAWKPRVVIDSYRLEDDE